MKTLNNKNLKTINSKLLEYNVLNMIHDKRKDLEVKSEEWAYGSYCYRKATLIAVDIYKEFGIAFMSEKFLQTEIIPNEDFYKESLERAWDNWQEFKQKEVA
jgi:hypothetical protein